MIAFKKYIKMGLNILPDGIFLRLLYFYNFKKFLHLNHPQTFNEKIQYFKLHQTQQIFSDLSDKFKVREYVKKTIPEDDILIPLLWFGERFEDIPFDTLPASFIIKCNHGSGYNIVVYDKTKLDIEKTKHQIQNWLKEDFGAFLREKQYTNIKRRILVEKLLPGEYGVLPIDYRMHCFGGKVELIGLSLGRNSQEGITGKFYDSEWNELDYGVVCSIFKQDIPKPKNLEKLIEYAQRLSEGFAFVRVDLYNINGEIYFGEMTFTASSGLAHFFPDHDAIDKKLGTMISLR